MSNLSEETPVTSVGTAASTGSIQGVNPAGPPVVRGKFAGCDVFDVDNDTFYKCVRGAKRPQQRWKN